MANESLLAALVGDVERTLIPTRDNVVVGLIEREPSVGGVAIPDTVRKTTNAGIVLAIGRLVTEVAIGDKVQVRRWTAPEIYFRGLAFMCMPEADVLVKEIEVEETDGTE